MNNAVRYPGYKSSRCSLCINKVGSVRLPGELGTRIDDDTLGSTGLIADQNRPYITATVYEESRYRLDVQLDCGGQSDSPCSNSLTVVAWIDFNDNNYDDGESRVLDRSWSDNGTPTGAYFLDIYVPAVDGRTIREGRHRMRLTVKPSDEYRRDCGNIQYEETRDYDINVLRRRIITSRSFSVSHFLITYEQSSSQRYIFRDRYRAMSFVGFILKMTKDFLFNFCLVTL